MTPLDPLGPDSLRPRRRLLIWSGAITAAALLGAAALVICAPWQSPDPPIATGLPATCPALSGLPTPEQQAGGGTGPGDAQDTNCAWGEPVSGGFPPVEATTTLYPTIAQAQHESATQVSTDTPIPGVGDEARISDHGNLIILVARKANVVLTLQYLAPGGASADQDRALLTTAARTILGGITLTTD